MSLLETDNITVSFSGKKILDGINIHLEEGELVSILGVSGGGKSTLFNTIAGLLVPDSGKVLLSGEDITGRSGQVSYMLQKDLMLPYKTILDNVALPLQIRGMSRREARKKASGYFAEFGLEGTQKKYPSRLSGGMRQRAALLRTYLFSDRVALLDEPFSALDAITKTAMHDWYLSIMEQIRLSTLFITHDIDEAILLSDRIYILGGTPGHVTKEIVIEPEDRRRKEILLSDRFLTYKRAIVTAIEESKTI